MIVFFSGWAGWALKVEDDRILGLINYCFLETAATRVL